MTKYVARTVKQTPFLSSWREAKFLKNLSRVISVAIHGFTQMDWFHFAVSDFFFLLLTYAARDFVVIWVRCCYYFFWFWVTGSAGVRILLLIYFYSVIVERLVLWGFIQLVMILGLIWSRGWIEIEQSSSSLYRMDRWSFWSWSDVNQSTFD